MAKLRGTFLIILIAVILYLITLFLQNIYIALWQTFVYAFIPLLDLRVFGYIILALSIVMLIAFYFTNLKKHPFRRVTFLIAFALLLIMALPYVFPEWYFAIWRF